MLLSRNALFVEDFPEKERHLLFHTRTQAQLVISEELRQILKKLPKEPESAEAEEALGQLQEMGFLVPDYAYEDCLLEGWFGDMQRAGSESRAIVLTTYDCNFACSYCVERGIRSSAAMDSFTAREVVSYLGRQIENRRPERLFITFYGGEPLLNLPILRKLAKELQELCWSTDLPFAFGITTNGSLLSRKVVRELAAYGLKGVKITLDGDRENHDRCRVFRDGRGSFDGIMRNILSIVDLIDVDIGGNFLPRSRESFIRLLDYLLESGLAEKLHQVSFKPVIPDTGIGGSEASGGLLRMGDEPADAPCIDMGCVFSDPEVMENMVALRRASLERGFAVDPGIGIHLCTAAMGGGSVVIDPQGALYSCPAFVGREELRIGHVEDPKQNGGSSLGLWKRCRECVFVPLCGDGCLYASYLRFGDMKRLNCQRDFMEYVVRENLKLNYRFFTALRDGDRDRARHRIPMARG